MDDQDTQSKPPRLLCRSNDISGNENFTRGCQFSPDGLCVLTCTASDNLLRLYNTPQLQLQPPPPSHPSSPPPSNESRQEISDVCVKFESESSAAPVKVDQWKTILSAKAGDSVRTYSWYPLMNSYEPASCAFLSSCRYVQRYA